jgi:hypothetical protein
VGPKRVTDFARANASKARSTDLQQMDEMSGGEEREAQRTQILAGLPGDSSAALDNMTSS